MPWVLCQVVRRRTAQEDSIRPLLFPGYHATCLPIKWSSLWCLNASVVPSQRPGQHRNGVTLDPTPLNPFNGKGTDTTRCPKKAVITGRIGDCYISTGLPIGPGRPSWCQVLNKYQQDRVIAELLRAETQTHFHFRSSQKHEEKKWGYWYFLKSVALHGCFGILSKQKGNYDLDETSFHPWQRQQQSILQIYPAQI